MKLLLTGAFPWNEKQLDMIKSLGYETDFVQDERIRIDMDLSVYRGVVCNGLFLNNPIEKFESLDFIQLTSAGLDRVSVEYIREKGIKLYNARGVYSKPMAEFALCGVLDLLKQSRYFYNNQQQHIWNKHRKLGELAGKTVLIVGAGSIGTECAKRFEAFETKVIGVDPFENNLDYFDELVKPESLEEILPKADIVVLTLPLTDDNKGFFDRTKLDIMKPSAILVNISRGALVNENDLVKSLAEMKIYGAVLDVFESEPLSPDNPLWNMDNVILTPHNSFVGENNNTRMFNVIYNNLKDYCNI